MIQACILCSTEFRHSSAEAGVLPAQDIEQDSEAVAIT